MTYVLPGATRRWTFDDNNNVRANGKPWLRSREQARIGCRERPIKATSRRSCCWRATDPMHLRACIAAALLIASITPVDAAQGPEAFAETVVDLRVNGQADATTLMVRRDTDGTLLLRAADLPQLRLRKPARGAVMVNGERYYRMGAENSAVAIFDEATQSVQLTLPAKAFVATHARAPSADTPQLTRSAPGAFVNYDVSLEQRRQGRQAGGLFELGAFGRHGVAIGTLVARQEETDRSLVGSSRYRVDARLPGSHRDTARRRRYFDPRQLGAGRAFRRHPVRHEFQHATHARHAPRCSSRRVRPWCRPPWTYSSTGAR